MKHYGTYVFRICILPYLCVMQYSTLYMSKDTDYSKLDTFKSPKEVVCTTHLCMESKERRERLRRRNQYDRDRCAAESA